MIFRYFVQEAALVQRVKQAETHAFVKPGSGHNIL
jgi:hypothetical protein